MQAVRRASLVLAACVLALCPSGAGAADQAPAGPDPQLYAQTVSKAVEFLKTAQAADGSYSKQAGPAVTALITTGLLRHGRTVQDPQVAKALKFLESSKRYDKE